MAREVMPISWNVFEFLLPSSSKLSSTGSITTRKFLNILISPSSLRVTRMFSYYVVMSLVAMLYWSLA